MSIKHRMYRRLGQGLAEYALILAVIAIGSIGFLELLGVNIIGSYRTTLCQMYGTGEGCDCRYSEFVTRGPAYTCTAGTLALQTLTSCGGDTDLTVQFEGDGISLQFPMSYSETDDIFSTLQAGQDALCSAIYDPDSGLEAYIISNSTHPVDDDSGSYEEVTHKIRLRLNGSQSIGSASESTGDGGGDSGDGGVPTGGDGGDDTGDGGTPPTGGDDGGDSGDGGTPPTGGDDSGDDGDGGGGLPVDDSGGPGNQAPEIAPPANQTLAEGEWMEIAVSASDTDGDSITLTSDNLAAFMTLTDNSNGTGVVRIEPGSSDAGTYPITITASDGQGNQSHAIFSIEVTKVNDAPVLGNITDVTMTEGGTQSIQLTASDLDGDPLSLSMTDLAFGSLADNGDGTGTITLNPASGAAGSYSVTVTVDDGSGKSDTEVFSILVQADNNAPVLAAISNYNLQEGDSQTVNLSATDSDGDTLSFSISGASFATLTDNGDGTGRIALNPASGAAGSYTVIVTVADGNSGSDSETFTVTVEAPPPNNAPVLAAISNYTLQEGDSQTINLSATDSDGDTLSFSISGASFTTLTDNGDGTGRIALNPASGAAGSYTVTVTVADGNSGSDSETFTVTVEAPPSNTIAFILNNPNSISSSDQAQINRLTGMGYDVVTYAANTNQATVESGAVLIFVSESINSSDVGNRFLNSTLPFVTTEGYILDDMYMAQSYGQVSNKKLTMDNFVHPVAAGLTNTDITVYSNNQEQAYGANLGSGATVIGHIQGQSSKYSLFVYDAGATLTNGSAAAGRRVLLFTRAAHKLRNDGWSLFDAAINWAITGS